MRAKGTPGPTPPAFCALPDAVPLVPPNLAMTDFDKILGELLEASRPKTWADIVPDCSCSRENYWFCPACIRWYIDISY